MGMVRFFKSVFQTVLPASNAIGQGAQDQEKKAKPRLFDVTDGYFVAEETKKWGIGFLRRSVDDFDDFRRKVRTRRKVRRFLGEGLNTPDIVEEVTERICRDAKEDSRLRRLFG